MMTKGDHKGGIFFYPTLTQIMDSSSCQISDYAEMQHNTMKSFVFLHLNVCFFSPDGFTPGRRQSKTQILSRNVDKKSIEKSF